METRLIISWVCPSRWARVRFGSQADICGAKRIPESGHVPLQRIVNRARSSTPSPLPAGNANHASSCTGARPL